MAKKRDTVKMATTINGRKIERTVSRKVFEELQGTGGNYKEVKTSAPEPEEVKEVKETKAKAPKK